MKPLNIFQRCIRVWEETHPYNAAQILHIQGTPDLQKLTDTWNDALASSGLGAARVDGRHFCYESPPRQELTIVEPSQGLEAHITQEINRPFANVTRATRNQPCTTMPFRPFLLSHGDSFHLGVMYQHWVADSISLRMLLKEWFCRLYDPASATSNPLQVPHGGFWRYFGPGPGNWSLSKGAFTLARSMSQFKSARRLHELNDDHRVACSIHRIPDGMIDDLLQIARRRKMTLNDLFLAALAKACDEHGAAPPNADRPDLALGSIVDLRSMSTENLENTFSLFLGFTAVVAPASLLADRDRLIDHIAHQNARQKQHKAAHTSMLRMTVGYAQGIFLSQKQLASFYRNYLPFSGGISNVNMNRSWPAHYHPTPLLDYLRVAPTGPMVPLVIAITTIGKKFSFVLTRRTSLVDANRGHALADTFIEELTAHAKAG